MTKTESIIDSIRRWIDGEVTDDPIAEVEAGSRLRVLQVSGKWFQVQVIEHGRPKADPDSSDEGWVNSINLRKS